MSELSTKTSSRHAHFINQILKPHVRTRHTRDFLFYRRLAGLTQYKTAVQMHINLFCIKTRYFEKGSSIHLFVWRCQWGARSGSCWRPRRWWRGSSPSRPRAQSAPPRQWSQRWRPRPPRAPPGRRRAASCSCRRRGAAALHLAGAPR